MTALEYMERQASKHKNSYAREASRGAPEIQLENIRRKIGYYAAAAEALKEERRALNGQAQHLRAAAER